MSSAGGERCKRKYKSGSIVFFTGAVYHAGAGYNPETPHSKRIYMYIDSTRISANTHAYLFSRDQPDDYHLQVDEECTNVYEAILKCFATRDWLS